MKEQQQQILIARAVEGVGRGQPDMGDQVSTSPIARYTDPGRYISERTVLNRHPRPIAAASDLKGPGDWIASDSSGVPVVVLRGQDGKLKAYLNVCRHRGMQLVPCGKGEQRTHFSCPYHAWNYDADGKLVNIPKAFGFPDLDKEKYGLRRLAVAERAGLIWIINDPDLADIDIPKMLGPFIDEIENFGFANHVGYAPRRFNVNANWKLLADGSLEDYHFQTLHQKTSAPFFTDTAQIVDEKDKHCRFFLVKKIFKRMTASDLVGRDVRELGNILYFFFPATWFLVQPDHAMVTFINPNDVSSTDLNEIALIPSVSGVSETGYWHENVDLFRKTLDEDYVLAEKIQRSLDSGANEFMTFGRFEQALERFHRDLENEFLISENSDVSMSEGKK